MVVTGKKYKITDSQRHLHEKNVATDINLTMCDVISAGVLDYNIIDYSWSVTHRCQYECDYCYAWNYIHQDISLDYLTSWKSVVKKLSLNRSPTFNIELVGGEPTLHPELLDIVKQLTDIKKCNRVEIITNLAKPSSYYSMFDELGTDKIQINASYHPKYHTDKFLDKCNLLSGLNNVVFYVNINIMFERDMWDVTASTMIYLKQHGIDYGLNLLHRTERYSGFSHNNTGDTINNPGDIVNEFLNYVDAKYQLVPGTCIPEGLDNRAPYTTTSGDVVISELDIRHKGLDKFYNNFTCTPTMWNISHDGVFTNACTRAKLDPLFRNITSRVTCPVETGCECDVMLLYPKVKQ